VSLSTLARLFSTGLGVAAVAWGVIVFPGFWAEASLEQTARQIIARAPFDRKALLAQLPAAETAAQDALCRPNAVRSAAILKLRIFEDTYTSDDVSTLDARIKDADDAIRYSLTCAPSDAFLWMVLYTVASTRNGFRPEYLEYARMSYRLGPNEGWVGLKRTPALLAIYERLPPDLAENVAGEFARIVENEFYLEAVAILSGPGWRVRDQLLRRLERIPLSRRELFEKVLYASGITVPVPGVVVPERRNYR
jgi:hypothetical protein